MKTAKISKHQKKFLSVLLAIVMVVSALPLTYITAAADDSGNYSYTVISEADKTCKITDYKGTAADLVIPESIDGYAVTRIGSAAFYGCYALTSVVIPNSVTSIGDDAFAYCTSLTSVTIPDSVTSIGEQVFSDCFSLTSITVDSKNSAYSSIDGVLFNKEKSELICYPVGKEDKSYTIPDSVKSIGDRAFSYCFSLTSVTIGNSVTSIGNSAFFNCTSLTSVTIGNSVTSIGNSAFSYCKSLTSVTIGNSVTSIGDGAFADCTSLTSIVIPDSVTSIGSYAFADCTSLTSIVIPDSVTSIGNEAFSSCTSLKSITVDDKNPAYLSIDGVLFNKNKTKLICYPAGKEDKSYTIPDNVKSIGERAFSSCTSLTSVTIPDSVTIIDNYAFFGCSFTSVTIGNSVTRIGKQAFSCCSSLKSVTIGNSVTHIDEYAFSDSSWLTSVVIPNSVTSIGYSAFCDTALTDVYYNGTYEQWQQIDIKSGNSPLLNANIHFNTVRFSTDIGEVSLGGISITAFNKTAFLEGAANLVQSNSSTANAKLSGVVISGGGLSESFDGSTQLTSKYRNKGLTFSCNSFYNYYVPAEVTESWFSSGKAEAKNIYMQKDKLDGKPYVSTVFARESGDGNAYVELQSEALTAMADTKYDLIIRADLAGAGGAQYCLSQDDAHKISNSSGIFSSQDLQKTFNTGKEIFAYVKTSSGVVSEPVSLKLNITDIKIPTDSFSLLGKEGTKIKLDKDNPLVGGAEISMDGFEFPLGLEITGNKFKISFGLDVFSLKPSDAKTKNDTWDSFKKSISLLGNIEDKTEKLKEYKKFRQMFAPGQSYSSKSANFDVSMLGFAEGTIVNGDFVFTEAGGEVTAKFKFKYTQQGTIWIIPVYGYVGAGGDASVKINSVRTLPDRNVPFDFGLTLKIKPELDIGLGVGVKGAVSGGFYGKGSLPFENDFTAKHTVVKLSGEVGVEAELFCFSGKKTILDGSVTLYDNYYGKSNKMSAFGLNSVYKTAGLVQNPFEFNSLNNSLKKQSDTVTSVMPRDYLKNTSGWLDNSFIRRFFSSKSSADGVKMKDLKRSVFKNSQTQLITLNDGRMMMVWIDDNSDRDSYNRMQLVYSIYENGIWSKPLAVDNDGTNDGYPSLATDGTNIFVAWQNINRILTESDFDSIDAILKNSEICISQYNLSKNCFENKTTVTDNASYDYMPTLAVENGIAALYWLNSKNNDLTTADCNDVYRYLTSDKNVALVHSGLNYILNMDCAFIDGNPQLSYSMDTDGDVASANDVKAFSLTDSSQIQISPENVTNEIADFAVSYGMLDGKNTLFFVNNNNIYYRQNDEIKTVFNDFRSINGELQVLNEGEVTTVMWVETTPDSTGIWICTYSDGKWSEPIQISEVNDHLHDFSAVLNNGRICSVFDRTERIADGESYTNGQTDLVYMTMGDYTDLQAEYNIIDESQFAKGEKTTIPICLKNNGTKDITSVKLRLTDGMGTDITIEKDVFLTSGETCNIDIDYLVPQDYSRTALNLETTVIGETDINMSNNTDSKEIGFADISIGEITAEDVGEYFVLTAVLSNDNVVTAENVEVNILSGSRDGEQLDSVKVGTLQSGEKRSIQYIVEKDFLNYDADMTKKIYFVASIPDTTVKTATASSSANELITEDNATGTVLKFSADGMSVLPGDLNGDGNVDAADAVLIQRYDSGLATLTAEQLSAADVTGDGTVDAADAVKIQRYDAGLISEL